MRLLIIAVIAVVTGCVVGFATTWYHEMQGVTNYFEPRKRTAETSHTNSPNKGEPRAVIVGGSTFDFGTLEFNSGGERVFVIRNEGEKPLDVHSPTPSCGKCITFDFTSAHVLPGESCEVVVKYAAKKEGQNFSESLNLKTNDPDLPYLKLDITGIITVGVRSLPTDLALGAVSVTDTTEMTVKVFGYRSPHIELVETKFGNPTIADKFEITTEPLPTEEVTKIDKHASCGLLAHIKIKPGLPLGRINQIIQFSTRTDSDHLLEIPVIGDVVGDISLIGPQYKSEIETLLLGIVPRAKGRIAKMHIIVKGIHRNDVKITVGEIDPADVLKVTLGEGVPINNGKAIDFPMTVEVLKDKPTMTRLGNDQGPSAKIMLNTTHPTAKQIQVLVKFAIE